MGYKTKNGITKHATPTASVQQHCTGYEQCSASTIAHTVKPTINLYISLYKDTLYKANGMNAFPPIW